jgi:excisionase family DNA binding protein
MPMVNIGNSGNLGRIADCPIVQIQGIDKMKNLFTTGEAAQICKVSQQTIIRCFDSGRLTGFRIPGSKFRRIPRESLIKFMKDNNIPLDNLESGKKKVLIVDDDAEIVELMVDVLVRDGRFEVRTATSGYDAGILTQQFFPDVIVLDYMLPDVNGNVVCQTIRRNAEFERTKIIIVSGVINQSEIDDLLKSGAQGFIKKPFNIAQLVDEIAKVLEMA